jgi:hypothetical protein
MNGGITPQFLTLALDGDGGTRQHSWLWHYTTNRKVMGSTPDEVIGFFN